VASQYGVVPLQVVSSLHCTQECDALHTLPAALPAQLASDRHSTQKPAVESQYGVKLEQAAAFPSVSAFGFRAFFGS